MEEARCTPQAEFPPSSREPEVLKKSTTLIVYYSRTGNTRAIAESIKDTLGCDIQEINDLKDRSGVSGFVGGMIDVRKNPTTDISPKEVSLVDYNLLIIGSPGWGGKITPAINTFINMTDFTGKKVVLFSVVAGQMPQKTLNEYSELINSRGGQVIDTFIVKTLWINQDEMRAEAKKICTERKGKWLQ
jgi:flavodoxin